MEGTQVEFQALAKIFMCAFAKDHICLSNGYRCSFFSTIYLQLLIASKMLIMIACLFSISGLLIIHLGVSSLKLSKLSPGFGAIAPKIEGCSNEEKIGVNTYMFPKIFIRQMVFSVLFLHIKP